MRKLNQLILGACTLLALACSPQPKQEQFISAYKSLPLGTGTVLIDTPERTELDRICPSV